ncbi:MAG: glycosyltransferase, partial [Candidatus Eisenbacteria bacterium]|nr:glycosyltransferase [Candidatus Eisenbacteria bacterium]
VVHYGLRHWTSAAGAGEILRALARLRPEVCHLNLPSPYEGLRNTVALWARLAGAQRVVATEHLPMAPRARRRVLMKQLLMPAVDAFIVMTRSGEEDLRRIHAIPGEKIVRIPYGIDPAPEVRPEERAALLEEIGQPGARVLIGHLGRLTRRKGHHVLLEALAQQRERLAAREVAVVFAGEGEEEENLRRQIAASHLAGRVHLLGHRENARRLIGILDLLVLPSFIETQPFVILEAMAAGVPVLSTAIYGIPDMVVSGETGLLVEPGDTAGLGAALARLVDDGAARDEMGAAARRRFDAHFRVDRMAARTARIYNGGSAA